MKISYSALLFVATTALLVSACGKTPDELTLKKKELAAVRTSMADLSEKARKLEAEIAKLDPNAKAAGKVRLVATAPVVSSDFNHVIDLQGYVVADDEVYVTPKMPGTITRLYVKTGDQVKKGQLLAELDAALITQNKAALQTQIDLAVNLYNRQKQLWDQKLGTEIQYVQAKSQVEALQKQLSILDEQADQMKIYAPMSGVCDEVTMKVGQPSSPGAVMSSIRLLNLSKLKVKTEVPEAYAGKFRDGAGATLVFPDLQREVGTKISYVSKVVNPINRTFTVELAMPPGQKDVMPNLTTLIKMADYAKANAIVVPVNAVQKDLEGDFVYLARAEGNETIARKARVKVGQVFGQQAEILSGLQVGDQLITVGFQDVNEGDRVTTK
jgi:RND family efflux transporter MFP subunit